jgi:uncharacterized membrane protein
MTLESSKILGGIGSILLVIGPFGSPYTTIVGLAGLVLVLIALNDLANHYKERRIFNNYLYGVVTTIVGAVIAGAVAIWAAFGILSVLDIKITNWTDWSALRNYDWKAFTNWTGLAPYLATIAGALVLLFVCLVIAAILMRRSLNTLSQKSDTHLFATTGLLFLIGAALTIILIGYILLWITLILLAVSFFEMRTEPTQPQTTQPAP